MLLDAFVHPLKDKLPGPWIGVLMHGWMVMVHCCIKLHQRWVQQPDCSWALVALMPGFTHYEQR